jgi:hypothetical protein
MTQSFHEQARLFLPQYLAPARTAELYEALKQFPDLPNFYLAPESLDEDLLQGDGWRGFVITEFGGGKTKPVSGIILSNSCDIDTANPEHLPRRVLFSPLVSLFGYEAALRSSGLADDQVASTLDAIRRQRITSIFHLPSAPYGPDESIVLLDDVHPHPLAHFKTTTRTRLFRLHQSAFYVFVVKLSIHFCRLQEGVGRFSEDSEATAA